MEVSEAEAAGLPEVGAGLISPTYAAQLFAHGSPTKTGVTEEAPASEDEEPEGFGETQIPWERLPKESDKAFNAFKAYRDLGPGRSTAKVAELHKRGASQLQEWCRIHSWVRRATAYDAYLDGKDRQHSEQARQQELEAYRIRQLKTAVVTSNLAVRIFGKIARTLDSMEAKPYLPELRDASGKVTREAQLAKPEEFIDPARLPNWLRAAVFTLTAGSATEAQALAIDTILASIGVSHTGVEHAVQGTAKDGYTPTPASIAAGA